MGAEIEPVWASESSAIAAMGLGKRKRMAQRLGLSPAPLD